MLVSMLSYFDKVIMSLNNAISYPVGTSSDSISKVGYPQHWQVYQQQMSQANAQRCQMCKNAQQADVKLKAM